jgi:translocation and assembly module TamB
MLQFRLKEGKLSCDPIDARLNDGALHLEPIFTWAEQGGSWLTFDRNSSLRGGIINEEVSHRVLSFAAPVLDGATRVRGRVSVAPVDIAFPLNGTTAPARIEGDVLFDDVRFMPGPLAFALIQFFVRGAQPALVLRDPISVRIADRKVYQTGLKLPVAQLATIELEGSVDFDRRLDLVGRLKVNPGGNNNAPFLSTLIQVARLEIPIRGTLSEPRIDEDGFKQRMKSVGSDLIDNSLQLGVEGLGQIFKNIGKRRERKRGPQ